MSGAAYLVLYEGAPDHPQEFLRYYVEEHIPLLWSFPAIRGVEIDLGRDDGDLFMVVRLLFDDLSDLHAAITSDARERARTDMQENFPEFQGRVRHQVVERTAVSAAGIMEPALSP